MYRYVALIWDKKNSNTSQFARSLSHRIRQSTLSSNRAVEHDGFILLDARERPNGLHAYVLPHGGGVVVGKLFFKDASAEDTTVFATLNDRQSREIVDSSGRRLIEKYWGQYVAFINEYDKGKNCILRDPSGGLNCYYLTYNNIHIFFSHIEDIFSLGEFILSINYKYLAAHIYYPLLSIRETGIREVSKILPGECLTLSGEENTKEFYWNPCDIVRSRTIEDWDEAAVVLRQTTMDCVSAWGSCYDTVLHRLSGGLDSSIVAACLGAGGKRPDVVCLNLHTDRPEADERTFARVSARMAGYELHEQVLQAADADIDRLIRIPKLATPFMHSLTPELEDVHTHLAIEKNADAIFSGQGGDHLFHQAPVKLVAADYAYNHGLSPRLFEVAYQTSLLTGQSIWSVLANTAKHGWFKRPYIPYSEVLHLESFLNGAMLEALTTDYIFNPWLKETKGVPPGKVRQIAALIDLHSFFWPYDLTDHTDIIHPLISQPLIEVCLAIPTYIHTRGGKSRALARYAFRDDIPEEISLRRTKGRTDTYHSRIYSKNPERLKTILLDGELSKAGLIDRRRLEERLSRRSIIKADKLPLLRQYINVEAWLRSWSDVGQKAAA